MIYLLYLCKILTKFKDQVYCSLDHFIISRISRFFERFLLQTRQHFIRTTFVRSQNSIIKKQNFNL